MKKLVVTILSVVALLSSTISFSLPAAAGAVSKAVSPVAPVAAVGPVLSPPPPSEVRQTALLAGLNALSPALAPEPPNLLDFLNPGPAARTAAIQLGKALFWDTQAGSDGQACGSCHFQAGADGRAKNQLNPGFRHVPASNIFNPSRSGNVTGPNYTLVPGDFPFHALQNPNQLNFNNRAVTFDTDDVVSSQGVFSANFTGSAPARPADNGAAFPDPIFKVGNSPVNVRHVEPRNTPTVINAVFNFENFWDGRAQNEFNGVSPLGHLDDAAGILVLLANSTLSKMPIRIPNASLASQAVGPPLSDLEMSFAGRSFPDVGRKLLDPARIPLATQIIDPNDSVLGPLEAGRGGLATTYAALIQQAFQPKYWASPILTNGYTQMESNFSLFWGLAIQMYEATLVSDQTPFDRFMRGDDAALTPAQLKGLLVFINTPDQQAGIFQGLSRGACILCHAGPEFTEASIAETAPAPIEIHRTVVNNNGILLVGPPTAFTDIGFANIGVRPTSDDLGRGGTELGKPLSVSRQAVLGIPFSPPLPIVGELGALPPLNNRVVADGTFKIPGLRNVELTGPYFHNGGAATLKQVISFYRRHGDFSDVNIQDVSPNLALINLNQEDEEPLAQFLLSLTDDRVRQEQAPFDHPQLFVPNGHPGNNAAITQTNLVIPIQAADNLLEIPAVGALGRPDIGLGPETPFLEISQVSPPITPSNLATGTVQPGKIVLTWADNSADEVGFRIQRSSVIGFNQDLFEDIVPPNTPTYTDLGASAGVAFFYRVFAFNEAATSAPSNVVTATPPPPVAAPVAPTNLDGRVMRGPTEVDITWADLSNDENGFRIERSDNGGTFVPLGSVGASINYFSDITVIVGHRYTYHVIATNTIGQNVSPDFAVDVSPPATPSNMALQPVSPTLIKVTWNDTANNEIGFRIERSTVGDFALERMVFLIFNPSFSPGPRPLSPPGVIEVDDATVGPGPLLYRVFAFNDLGDSLPSATVAINAGVPPPAAPSALTAVPISSTAVTLTWIDNSTTESGFMVQRSTDGTFVSGVIELHTPINVTSFNDITVSANTSYFYRVLAVSPAGNSLPSNMVAVTTPTAGAPTPPPPTPAPAPVPAPVPVTAPAPAPIGGGGGGGGGSGVPVFNPKVNLLGFITNTAINADISGIILSDVQVKTENDGIVLNIPAGTKMVDKAGQRVGLLSVSPSAAPPAAPDGGFIVLAYTMGPDGAQFTPAIGLAIKFDPAKVPANSAASRLYIAYHDGDKWVKMDSVVEPVASTVASEITHFTEFAVIAGAGPVTTPTPELKPALVPEPAPAAPLSLTATVTPSGAVTLHWVAPSNNENLFMIERATNGSFVFDGKEVEFHTPADVTTLVDTTVKPNTTYFYRVMAGHGVGTSATSNVASVTTPLAAMATPIPAPTLTPAPAPAPPTPTPAPAATTSQNWGFIAGIGGAAALIILVVLVMLLRRRRQAGQ